VLDIDPNLFSVGQLLEKGCKVFENKQCSIKDTNERDLFKVKIKKKLLSIQWRRTIWPLNQKKVSRKLGIKDLTIKTTPNQRRKRRSTTTSKRMLRKLIVTRTTTM